MERLVKHFENKHPITTVHFEGKPYWIAQEIGEAIGYSKPSNFTSSITRRWSELIEGEDYIILRHEKMNDFRKIHGVSEELKVTPNLLLLSESGVNLALIKTRKPLGVKLRRWLADEVVPQLTRTGQYTPPTIPPPPQPKTADEKVAFLSPLLARLDLDPKIDQTVKTLLAIQIAELGTGIDLSYCVPVLPPEEGWVTPTAIAANKNVPVHSVGRAIQDLGFRNCVVHSRPYIHVAKGKNGEHVTCYLYSPHAVRMIEALIDQRLCDAPEIPSSSASTTQIAQRILNRPPHLKLV